MKRLRASGFGVTVVAWSMFAGAGSELGAQATVSRASSRVRSTAPVNACMDLQSSPSALVNAPEGMVLLRLKRELESAALVLEKNRQLEAGQVQRFSQVQRGMDSLMQVVVRYYREDGTIGPTVTVRRGDPLRVVEGRAIDARRFFGAMDSTARVVGPSVDSSLRMLAPMADSTWRMMSPQIEAVLRVLQPQVAAFTGEVEARMLRNAAPVGYMGLSLSGAQLRTVTSDGVLTSHCEYPLVETVDVGSPAARAGLNAGDTLTAYNGRDVLQVAVNYPEMLAPGETVRVRVRRSGRTRELPVVVSPRVDEEGPRTMVFLRSPAPPSLPSSPPSPTVGAAGGAGLVLIAGAQFATIDEEFAQRLGVDPGVLVLRVPPGTPAADAGLRAGDVVRAVNGNAVRDATSLRRAMAGRDVRLLVQSKTYGTRTVVLMGRE